MIGTNATIQPVSTSTMKTTNPRLPLTAKRKCQKQYIQDYTDYQQRICGYCAHEETSALSIVCSGKPSFEGGVHDPHNGGVQKVIDKVRGRNSQRSS